MYEVESIKLWIAKVVDIANKSAVKDSGEESHSYQLGRLSAQVQTLYPDMAALRIEAIAKQVDRWERMDAAMLELGVDVAGKDLDLLEKLVDYKNVPYRYDKRELTNTFGQLLSEVADSERETEHDEAQGQLRTLGFEEDTELEGLIRTVDGVKERVIIEIRRTNQISEEFFYHFTLSRAGIDIVEGDSGEFSALLAAVLPGAPAHAA